MQTSFRLLLALVAGLLVMISRPAAAAEPDPHAATSAAQDAAHSGGHAATPKDGVLGGFNANIMTSVVALVVFSLVFAILAVKVWPAITKGLKDRENKIREEIESAEMARQQAKDALEQYQKSLADARAEAQKMLEAARAQQQALSAELKAKADIELSQMRERATRDIEATKRAAIADLYAQSSNLATMIAGKILRRNVTQADNQQLVEESLSQLETLKN
jgi:F-type H+-transporting ATPase subunit b